MLAVTSEFFDLPEEEKRRYAPPRPAINRGYAALGRESLSYSLGVAGRPDLFEAFNMGLDQWPRGDPYYEGQRDALFAPNIWPDHPTVLRDVWIEYFDAMQELSDWLMEIFALALGLPEDFFTRRCARAPDVMRANNYERRPGGGRTGTGADAHGRPHRLRRLHDPAGRPRARAADRRARRPRGRTWRPNRARSS